MDKLSRLKAAHARTGAPGEVVDTFKDCRYVVELPRPGRLPVRRNHPYVKKPDGRVTVHACWTEHTPDGKTIQHRRSATE